MDRSAPKEVGQGPLLPVPPAVVNAIYDAVGVRIDEVPATPEKVLAAIRDQGGRLGRVRAGRFGPGKSTFPAEGVEGRWPASNARVLTIC